MSGIMKWESEFKAKRTPCTKKYTCDCERENRHKKQVSDRDKYHEKSTHHGKSTRRDIPRSRSKRNDHHGTRISRDCMCPKCCDRSRVSMQKVEKKIIKSEQELLITHVTIDFDSTSCVNLTIIGTGMSSVKEIFVDHLIITDFMVVNDNKILAHIPELFKNSLCISVSDYSSTSNCIVCDLGESPEIIDINPSEGPMGPLVNITLFGENFTTLRSITVDGNTLHISKYPISISSDSVVSFILPYNDTVKDIPIYVTAVTGNSNTVYYHGVETPII